MLINFDVRRRIGKDRPQKIPSDLVKDDLKKSALRYKIVNREFIDVEASGIVMRVMIVIIVILKQ